MLDYKLVNTEAELRDVLENKLKFGVVSRIDFVTKPAVSQDARPTRCAFIHFDSWFETEEVTKFKSELAREPKLAIKVYGYQDGQYFRRFVSGVDKRVRRFISFKINWKPIPAADVSLNVHQLSALLEKSTKLIEEKDARILELEEKLKKYETETENKEKSE